MYLSRQGEAHIPYCKRLDAIENLYLHKLSAKGAWKFEAVQPSVGIRVPWRQSVCIKHVASEL